MNSLPSTDSQIRLTSEAARTLANRLMQSFPDTQYLAAQVKGVLLQQLTTILNGTPIEIAKRVCHPELGLPGSTNKLTAYNLRQWLDKQAPKKAPLAFKQEIDDWTPPTDEEREASKAKVSAFKAGIAVDKPKERKVKHIGWHDPDALLAAITRGRV